MKAKASALSNELADIRDAKTALLPAFNVARFEASAKVIDAVRPEYAPIARRVADALAELGHAWTEHRVFFRELAAGSVSTTTLQQVTVLGSEDGRDPLVLIGKDLNWAAQIGHYDRDDVPPEWQFR